MRQSDDWAAFALALPIGAEPGRATPTAVATVTCCRRSFLSGPATAHVPLPKNTFSPHSGFKGQSGPLIDRPHAWLGRPAPLPSGSREDRITVSDGGRWNGRQVVSEEWVKSRRHLSRQYAKVWVTGTSGGLTRVQHRPCSKRWVEAGSASQSCPTKTSLSSSIAAVLTPTKLRRSCSARFDPMGPWLTIRSAACACKDGCSRVRQAPASQRPAPLPDLAQRISGAPHDIDANPLKLRHLSLTFSRPAEARATLDMFDGEWSIAIGLDGDYRFFFGGPEGLPMAASGVWVSRDEFLLDLNTVANINHFKIRMQFAGDRVQLRIDEATGDSQPGRSRKSRPQITFRCLGNQ